MNRFTTNLLLPYVFHASSPIRLPSPGCDDAEKDCKCGEFCSWPGPSSLKEAKSKQVRPGSPEAHGPAGRQVLLQPPWVSPCAKWLYTSVSSLKDGGGRAKVGELSDLSWGYFHCEARRTMKLHMPHHVGRGEGPRLGTTGKKTMVVVMMVVTSLASSSRDVTVCQELL